MGEPAKRISTFFALEGPKMVMTGSYVHGKGGIMAEWNTASKTTPENTMENMTE